MEKLDYKKAEKHLYQPKGPAILRVPEMVFFAVEGSGDPNTSASYREALELLYGLSFTVKMSKLGGRALPGYFEYVVPPLEGLWWTDEPGFDGRTPGGQEPFPLGLPHPPAGLRGRGGLHLGQGGAGAEEAGGGPVPGLSVAVGGGPVRPAPPPGAL